MVASRLLLPYGAYAYAVRVWHEGLRGFGPTHPARAVDALAVSTNLPPNGAFRGYGATQSVWAGERAMDLLAERLEMSPLELRRRNLLRDGDRFATGEVMRDVHFEECLQAAADAVDYESDPRGKGLCVLLKGMQTPSRAAISVERSPVGYVVRCASCEMGGDPGLASPACAALPRGDPARSGARPHTDSSPATRTPPPLHLHDGPRADRGRRDLDSGRRERGSARSSTTAADPTPARASPRRTGTRGPRRLR